MMPPPSQPPVSVEETENGYIVHAGSAVATISKTGLVYVVDSDSQVLREEYNLSPGVARIRRSLWNVMRFSRVPADNTLLTLKTSCTFFLLSQAVEMVCGFRPENFPEEDEWMLLSSWKSEQNNLSEPEIVSETDAAEENTVDAASPDKTNEKPESTLSDIVSKVEDEVDTEFQSFSWTIKSGTSAIKKLDKTAFEHGETGVPKAICSFFGADRLPAGGKKEIYLIHNSERFSGRLTKDSRNSQSVKLYWGKDVSNIISEYQKKSGNELNLEFLRMLDLDTYNILLHKIDDLGEGENESVNQSLPDTKDETKTVIPPTLQVEPPYSSDVLKIYEAVSKLPRYRFGQNEIPNVNSGILFIFEDGEKYGDYDRITHITCNSGNSYLTRMIKDITTGDRYVTNVRKYIEEAVILKSGVNYVTTWQKNNFHSEVSSYISEHLSYSVLEIKPTVHRTATTRALLSTLIAEYSKHPCSDTWLGRYHSNPNILKRGIWNLENMGGVHIPFDADTLSLFLDEVNTISGKTYPFVSKKEIEVIPPIPVEVVLPKSVEKISEPTQPIPNPTIDNETLHNHLTKKTDSESVLAARNIHQEVSKLPRYHFDNSTKIAVENGILIVFEEGEKYGEYDRIVYVGANHRFSHLPEIIHDITSGNKDDAVLRKYIGEAILEKEGHPYARIWKKKSCSPESRKELGSDYDQKTEKETETRVSTYLKEHMSFSVIEIPDKTRRLLLQNQLISTLIEAYSQSPVSSTWLGRYHPDLMIQSANLWMRGNYQARIFNKEELQTFLGEIQRSQSGKPQVVPAPTRLPEVIVEDKKPITEKQIPVTKDIVPPVNEEPTLYDVLQMEDTPERERILLKVVKHHLKALGIENIQTFALAPLIINQTVSKSTLLLSYGQRYYLKSQIEINIQQLISKSTITSQTQRNFNGVHATYYKLRDVDRFILELNLRKEADIRTLTQTLENVTHSLNVSYPITNNDYINQNSPTYTKIVENLINPITSLGITQEVAKLLVYIHLFRNVAESDIYAHLQQTLSKGKSINLLRDLCHIDWIYPSEMQRNKGIIYSLTRPLEDILLDYVLNHAESLEKSVVELKQIIEYSKEQTQTTSEVYGLLLDEEEDVVVPETLSAYVDKELLDKQKQLEKSITSRLVKYGYEHASALVFLDLLLKRPVCEGALAPILQMQDEMSKEVIESLIHTHDLTSSIQKDREGKSERIYKMRYSPKNFVEKLLKPFEEEVLEAEASIEKIRDIEKRFIDSCIEGWIKPNHLPEFAELTALFCSLGLEEDVAKTLVLLSAKPNTSIQKIVDELALDNCDARHIEKTLTQKWFIIKQKTGETNNYHLSDSISHIIQAHIIQIRKNYDSEVREFTTLVNYLISVDGEIKTKYQQALEERKETLSRYKMLQRVFFTPFYNPLNSYMEITEQVYDLRMKKGFPDVRICLVELLPSGDGELLHASPLAQSELFPDTELLLYGYYKEYEQYVVWDFSPSYEVLKMRDLTVPKGLFDPVAGQDKVLLKTLPSGANIITCPVNKPYQAIKYWFEKKQEKEEEDSWFK